MATSTTLISAEEYLRSSDKPTCEYIDGVLRPKPLATFRHGNMEYQVSYLINEFHKDFEAIPELTVKLREGKYLVPDVAVQRVTELQQPYPMNPTHLCIEVLFPEDRFSEALAKCEDYHAWGVKFCWLIDPEKEQCWEFAAGDRP